ncbi:protein CLP1 homolog isoform X2 [Belonocnema kinseyi]|uniref:protein CLP1 homolog isoform X2 n=1 Tax=Belonocnema kinseyi TaxID=2817044 RepID=UPI00143D09B5|nr:protein CLP1 homolog isoform X2 [Belonocnema kinseyi]
MNNIFEKMPEIITKKIGVDFRFELTFEVQNENEKVILELKSGLAVICGRDEMLIEKKYEFLPGSKVSIFTWMVYEIELTSNLNFEYFLKETFKTFYRQMKKIDLNKKGPITMIVAPSKAKSYDFFKRLINSVVGKERRDATIMTIDLDVRLNLYLMSGSVTTGILNDSEDTGQIFKKFRAYHYGHHSPDSNPELYKLIVKQLSQILDNRIKADKNVYSSGAIINTCPWNTESDFEFYRNAVLVFNVDQIFILDDQKLYDELRSTVPDNVEMINLPKSWGLFGDQKLEIFEARDVNLHNFFYAPAVYNEISNVEVKFKEVKIYKIVFPTLKMPCLLAGSVKLKEKMVVVDEVVPGPNLKNSLFTISRKKYIKGKFMATISFSDLN